MSEVGQRPEELVERARAMLARDPQTAEQQLREFLRLCPSTVPAAHLLLGIALLAQSKPGDAIAPLRRASEILPDEPEVWRRLNTAFRQTGDTLGASRAVQEELRTSSQQAHLIQAALALRKNDLPLAEHLLRQWLKRAPDDIAALRMLAEVAGRLGRFADARTLLEHALDLAPSFAAARYNLAIVALRQQRPAEALLELDDLLAREPDNLAYRNLHGAALSGLGDVQSALADFQDVLAKRANQPRVWMNYGHTLKTTGRQQQAVDAYKHAITLDERLGEAWWSLANLKTVGFSEAELATMERSVARTDLRAGDALHFRFALGKAYEDRESWELAFRNYHEGNRLRRLQIEYSADSVKLRVDRTIASCSAHFLDSPTGHGCKARDPIFVVGMPRSGSTLIEQILASHSMVEGTSELPDIQDLARQYAGADSGKYPEELEGLSAQRLDELGQDYIRRTRAQRHTNRPFFIDKLPNNWLHIPLIHLILPNARIIDARRHPLACCFSNFKQHFARGQHFSYDLGELGRYYTDYVRLMDHVDRVLPGRVHRVYYEEMVTDTEAAVRKLLAYLGLEFQPNCLRFFENERSVRTASSEQVRRPIFSDGLQQWRFFAPWLEPLREALGANLTAYPYQH